ncbi:MAG TPA: cation transporter [Dehalococcoidia bacterium]|nr:cation transporter [Dehalococcoidia bacterium]
MTAESALRPRLVRRAMLLQAAVISYNLLEGAISIIAGVIAGSTALVGFGLDSAIEVSASVAVLAHLWRSREEEALEWERRVAVYVGLTLMALAVFVAGRAIYDLASGSQPDESYLGIGIAGASLVIMPLVSRYEHSLSHQINSRALEAESRETLVCSYLSATLLLGLGAHALLGWWWADPVAALVMVVVIAREGYEAFTRRELCCRD